MACARPFGRARTARGYVPHDTAAESEGVAADALLPPLLLARGLPGVRLRSAAAPLAAPRSVLSAQRTDLQRRGYRGILRQLEARGTGEGTQCAWLLRCPFPDRHIGVSA